jgi:hypothetical protein
VQNESLGGSTPAAARGAISPEVRLCLACLHENRGGEQSCEVCGTSLYLILCGACEAVNGPGALRCHGCGAALGAEAAQKPPVALAGVKTTLTRVEASDKPTSATTPASVPAPNRTSLARAEAGDKRPATPPARRINGMRVALGLAALLAVAALAYQYHYVPRTAPAERSHEGRIVTSAPVESSEPRARPAPPSKPPPRTKAAPSKPPASAGSAPKATQSPARVTHTRGDSSSTPAAAAVAAPAAPAAGQTAAGRCSEEVVALGFCGNSAAKGK